MEEREEKIAEAVRKRTKEEWKEHFKEYQMELIRKKGKAGPALPIPLTKEMDDQLVKEGVLSPRE